MSCRVHRRHLGFPPHYHAQSPSTRRHSNPNARAHHLEARIDRFERSLPVQQGKIHRLSSLMRGRRLTSKQTWLVFIPAFYSFFYGGTMGTYLSLHFSVRARALSTLIVRKCNPAACLLEISPNPHSSVYRHSSRNSLWSSPRPLPLLPLSPRLDRLPPLAPPPDRLLHLDRNQLWPLRPILHYPRLHYRARRVGKSVYPVPDNLRHRLLDPIIAVLDFGVFVEGYAVEFKDWRVV